MRSAWGALETHTCGSMNTHIYVHVQRKCSYNPFSSSFTNTRTASRRLLRFNSSKDFVHRRDHTIPARGHSSYSSPLTGPFMWSQNVCYLKHKDELFTAWSANCSSLFYGGLDDGEIWVRYSRYIMSVNVCVCWNTRKDVLLIATYSEGLSR